MKKRISEKRIRIIGLISIVTLHIMTLFLTKDYIAPNADKLTGNINEYKKSTVPYVQVNKENESRSLTNGICSTQPLTFNIKSNQYIVKITYSTDSKNVTDKTKTWKKFVNPKNISYSADRKTAKITLFASHSNETFKVTVAYKIDGKTVYEDRFFGPYKVYNCPVKFSARGSVLSANDLSGAQITAVKYYTIEKSGDKCPLLSSNEWININPEYNNNNKTISFDLKNLGLYNRYACYKIVNSNNVSYVKRIRISNTKIDIRPFLLGENELYK